MSETTPTAKRLVLAKVNLQLSIFVLLEKFIPEALAREFPGEFSTETFSIEKVYQDAEKATGAIKELKITQKRTGKASPYKMPIVESAYKQETIEALLREQLPSLFPAIIAGGCDSKELEFNWQDISYFPEKADNAEKGKNAVIITFPMYAFKIQEQRPEKKVDTVVTLEPSSNGQSGKEHEKAAAVAN